jgi:hypothetical protein
MPEPDAKTRTMTSTTRRIANGINHHFISRAQNRKNSRKMVHMDASMIVAGRNSVECYSSLSIKNMTIVVYSWVDGRNTILTIPNTTIPS